MYDHGDCAQERVAESEKGGSRRPHRPHGNGFFFSQNRNCVRERGKIKSVGMALKFFWMKVEEEGASEKRSERRECHGDSCARTEDLGEVEVEGCRPRCLPPDDAQMPLLSNISSSEINACWCTLRSLQYCAARTEDDLI